MRGRRRKSGWIDGMGGKRGVRMNSMPGGKMKDGREPGRKDECGWEKEKE